MRTFGQFVSRQRPPRETPKRPCKAKRRQAAVKRRWGTTCWLCHKPISEKQFSSDHVTPRSRGGSNKIDNLRPAHKRCNWDRGNNPPPVLELTREMMIEEAA